MLSMSIAVLHPCSNAKIVISRYQVIWQDLAFVQERETVLDFIAVRLLCMNLAPGWMFGLEVMSACQLGNYLGHIVCPF